jgi:phage tail sheath protein FI
MALSLLHPGVYIEEVPSGVRTIQGVATSIALFVGWAARGSTTRPARIGSFADYAREFGGLDSRTLLGHALMHFFANGGTDAYVVRLVDSAAQLAGAAFDTNLLQFKATSPGKWAEAFQIKTKRVSGSTERFRVDVLDAGGVVVESFPNLSMVATDPRFPTNVINGRSAIVTVTGTTPGTTAPADATKPLTGGADGAVLDPQASSNAFPNALDAALAAATDQIPLFNLLCVPGLVDKTALTKLQTLCRTRRAFLLVDSPEGETVANMGTALTGLTPVDAVNSALFYPWVRAKDPLTGAVASFPPCGFVAGVFARTDSARGVWKAPAGSDASLTGALELERTLSDRDSAILNPRGINCLRTLPVYGNVVWGSRTLHGDDDRGSEWKYVPVRRLALFLEESLFRGTQWVVFEPNDEPLWAQIRLNVGAFMNDLFRQGAFQGKSPREAYFVRCDRTTTTQQDIDRGIVNIEIGFAPLKPAEFVVLRIQQIAGELAT